MTYTGEDGSLGNGKRQVRVCLPLGYIWWEKQAAISECHLQRQRKSNNRLEH